MRRVAGTAGLLSLLAGVMLAAVWFDDGQAARRGPAVLAPITGGPDDVPGLGWVRLAVVLTAVAVAAAVPALVFAWRLAPAPVRPAAARTGGVLPPAPVAPPDRPVRAAARRAAVLHGLAAVAAGLAAWRLEGRATPAVPQEAVLLTGAAVGWGLVAWAPARQARLARVAVVATAVAVAVAAPLGGPWWVYGRLVDATTAAPEPDPPPPLGESASRVPAGGPATPGAVRWTRPAAGAMTLGRYVVLQEPGVRGTPRIVVVDAATGAERWSYRHADAYVGLAGDPALGVLVLSVNRDGARELRAFDLETGRPRWNRRDAGEVVGRDLSRGSGGVLSAPGVLLLLDRRATRLRGLNPYTGAQLWQRAVDPECAASADFVWAGDVLVVTSLCERTTLPAYRFDTGGDAWTATLADHPVRSRSTSLAAQVSGDDTVAVWVGDGNRYTLLSLDAGTGTPRWRRDLPSGFVDQTVARGRFVLVERPADRRLVAVALDPDTGRPAWTAVLPRRWRGPDENLVAGSDGTRWYLLAGVLPGGPGSTLVTVLDAGGTVLGVGTFDGCAGRSCPPDRVQPTNSTTLYAADGTLVVLPFRAGSGRNVVGIGPGPSFVPTE